MPPFIDGLRGRPVRQRTLPPGTSARRCGDLASWADPRAGARRASSNLRRMEKIEEKKWGARRAPRRSERENYRFFAAFFFPPLAAFFAIVFSSGCCDSASDEPLGRHYGWAEPSTLIPDVDYG